MRTERGINSTTTIAAACLAFGLWVVGCTPVPDAAPLPTLNPVPTVSVPSRSPSAPAAPAVPSPATPSVPAAGIPSVAVPAAPPTSPSAVPAPSRTSPGTSGPLATQPVPVLEPSPEPGTSAAEPTGTAVATTVDADGPAVYYVAIDDGGARGVRFGCNDSLVPVRGVSVPGDPLSVALGRLLEAGLPVDSDAALYDSLAGSSLTFLSGYMNGSTVVVNLSGSLRPAGICDVPRIQAQLIHTVVSATGASRAEIYVNGRTLTEALSVR